MRALGAVVDEDVAGKVEAEHEQQQPVRAGPALQRYFDHKLPMGAPIYCAIIGDRSHGVQYIASAITLNPFYKRRCEILPRPVS